MVIYLLTGIHKHLARVWWFCRNFPCFSSSSSLLPSPPLPLLYFFFPSERESDPCRSPRRSGQSSRGSCFRGLWCHRGANRMNCVQLFSTISGALTWPIGGIAAVFVWCRGHQDTCAQTRRSSLCSFWSLCAVNPPIFSLLSPAVNGAHEP